MKNTPSARPEAKESSSSPVMSIVLYTTLVSAVASLIVGILALIKRRQPTLPGRSAGAPADDQDQLLETSYRAATYPAIERISLPEEPQRMEQHAPKTTAVSSEAGELAMSQPANGILDQAVEAQLAPGKPAQSTRWSLPTKYVVGVGLFLALLFVVFISRSSLGMIIFAALLAFVAQPVINFFQRRWKMKRGSAIGSAYLLIIAILILIPLIIIPAIIQSINGALSTDWQSIGQNMAASLQTAAQNASSIPVIGPAIASSLEATAQLLSGAATLPPPAPVVVDVSAANIGGQLAKSLGKLAGILGPLISAFTSLIFMLLISLRISLAAGEMREAYPKLIPPSHKNEIIALVERLLNVWVSFLRGQLSLMVLMGFLTYLVNLLLGTPYALFLGVLAGVLEIIPNLGPVLATIPAVIFALVLGSSHLAVSNLVFAIIVILAYIMLSMLENQVIVPKLLGDAVDLPPLVVIVGCVIGGAAFGLLGVFLATPVISSSKEIFTYLYNKILEPPPDIQPPVEKPSMIDTIKGITQRFRWPFRREKKPLPGQSPAGTIEGSSP